MDPFQRDFEDEYALHEMIQEGTQAAGCFHEDQNEDDGSQYLNDTGDGDAETMEDMHVEDDIPRGIWNSTIEYEKLMYVKRVVIYIYIYIISGFRIEELET